jgi:hypothetical protein
METTDGTRGTPSRLNAFFAVMIGYFVNLGAASGRLSNAIWPVTKNAQKLIGTIVAERAFDVICLMIAFGLTFVVQFDIISSRLHDYVYPAFQNKNGQTAYQKIFILVAGLILFLFVLKIIFARFGHINIIQKVKDILTGVWHGLISVRALKNKPLFFFYTIGIWIMYLLSTWVGFFAIDATSHLTMADALTVLVMGSVGMIVSPGGLARSLLVMETVALYHILKNHAGSTWMVAMAWAVLKFYTFGVVSFILLPRVNRKK